MRWMALIGVCGSVLAPGLAVSAQVGDTAAVVRQYDRFRQVTTVSLAIDSVGGGVGLTMLATYPGERIPASVAPMWLFHASQKGWKYLYDHTVACLADGKPLGKMPSSHEGRVGSGYVIEFIRVPLTPAQFSTASSAARVACEIGTTVVEVPASAMASVRQFRAALVRAPELTLPPVRIGTAAAPAAPDAVDMKQLQSRGVRYVGDSADRRYVPIGCEVAASIAPKTRILFRTDSAAVAAGYSRLPQGCDWP